MFLNYDVSLCVFEINGVTYIEGFNPAWLGPRRFSPAGAEFRDNVYKSVKSVRLIGLDGNVTTSRQGAAYAEIIAHNGDTLAFELFNLDSNRTGGRLLHTRDAAGLKVLQFSYVNLADDVNASPDSKWLKSSASDLNGDSLIYSHELHASGRYVLAHISTPGGRGISYEYDANGNLARVNYPNGDSSTFTRRIDGGALELAIQDAGETGVHRNKTVRLSNNIAASLINNWDSTSRPVIYNQSSLLIHSLRDGSGELRFASVSGGTATSNAMWRRVYEGGGRLKFVDGAEKSSYTNWSVPNGVNPADPFGSFAATKEKNGHWSPYNQYAANRARQPGSIVYPDGPRAYYTYDASGNQATIKVGDKMHWRASDALYNKPILDVDYTGRAMLYSYNSSGEIASRKVGWVMDDALPVGTEISGVACSYYSQLPSSSFSAIDSATPDEIIGVKSISPAYRNKVGANQAMRFSGKLVLDTPGVRTFYMRVGNGQSRLHVNGGYYTRYAQNGETSISLHLSAGVHDIKWDTLGGVNDFSLSWSGPETLVNGVPLKTSIDSSLLRHSTQAGELSVRPSSSASEEVWEYYPEGSQFYGLKKAHVNGAGVRTEYNYDENRRLTQVKQSGDLGALVVVSSFTYDAFGNLSSQSDALGRTVNYHYDLRNRRIKTTYGDGTTETVKYGGGAYANLVVEEKNRAGNITKMEYDLSGRLVRKLEGYAQGDSDGAITSLNNNPSVETFAYLNGTTDVTRVVRNGCISEYEYDYKGRIILERSFPSEGKVLESRTTYSHDEVVFSETDVHGCRTFYAYRRPDMVIIRKIHELTPGSLGSLSDEASVLAVARDMGANPGYSITDYSRDLKGRVVAAVDSLGVKTTTIFNEASQVSATVRGDGLPNAQTTRFTYNGSGDILSTTDALGRVTQKEYSPSGRLITVIHPDDSRQEYTYYVDGKLATSKDPDGFVARTYWTECCARLLAKENPNGDGALNFYDANGRVSYTVVVKDLASVKSFGSNLPPSAVLSASTMQYDARGRIVASTQWNVVPTNVNPRNVPIAPANSADGFTTTYEYFDDLTDSRFAPALTQIAAQGITLTAGSATLVINPTGDKSFTISDAAGRTVASGQLN